MNQEAIEQALALYASSFEKVLYGEDTTFLDGMEEHSLACDDIRKYQFWEWTQDVGLFGFWKMFRATGGEKYLPALVRYYERQFWIGFPTKNVNTVTLMLVLSLLAEYLGDSHYLETYRKRAEWTVVDFPRTREGGFQHITLDSPNEGGLRDDILFMTVLFLANMGRTPKNKTFTQEAEYQFLVHTKYLYDKEIGLWYHGWIFLENNDFARTFQGKGNRWITAMMPESLKTCPCDESMTELLKVLLSRQAEVLVKYQEADGMWHTLIDDKTSYARSSVTHGLAYEPLKVVHAGLPDKTYREAATKPLGAILNYTDEEGVLQQISYGTLMGRKDKQFYREIPLEPMPCGQTLAILHLLEIGARDTER